MYFTELAGFKVMFFSYPTMMISHGPPMPTDIDFFQVKRWNHQYISRLVSAGDLIDCIHMFFDSIVLQRITLAKATQNFLPKICCGIHFGAKTLSDSNPRHFWFQFGDLRCEAVVFLACMVSLNTVFYTGWRSHQSNPGVIMDRCGGFLDSHGNNP